MIYNNEQQKQKWEIILEIRIHSGRLFFPATGGQYETIYILYIGKYIIHVF